MADLAKLALAADLALPMPWEKSASEVPYEHKQAFRDACSPALVLALLEVVKAAKAQVAAYDTLQNRPCGSFTGGELPACDRADEALRAALAALGEQQ